MVGPFPEDRLSSRRLKRNFEAQPPLVGIDTAQHMVEGHPQTPKASFLLVILQLSQAVCFTRMRSQVQVLYRPPRQTPHPGRRFAISLQSVRTMSSLYAGNLQPIESVKTGPSRG